MISHKDRVAADPNRFQVAIEGGATYNAEITRADNPTVEGNLVDKSMLDEFLAASGTAYHLENKITNGNFANGITGWTKNNVTVNIVGNEAQITASAQWGSITQSCAFISGHIYYLRADVKVTGVAASATVYWFDGVTYGQFSPATDGAYHTTSNRTTSTNTATGTIGVQDNRVSGWSEIDVKNLILIDLTAWFGAGNEPTKAWCDANIPFFLASILILQQDGYSLFDGAPVRFKLSYTNKAKEQLSINGDTPKYIKTSKDKYMPAACKAGSWITAVYSATTGNFTLQGEGGDTSSKKTYFHQYMTNTLNVRGW